MLTEREIRTLAYKVARMIGVRRRLKKIRFSGGAKDEGVCFPGEGIIKYPKWLTTASPTAYTVHFVIHEVIHLKYPQDNHQDDPFRRMEERVNKRFGIRIIFKNAYAISLHNLKGNLLWREGWYENGHIRKQCRDLDVNWRSVDGYIRTNK